MRHILSLFVIAAFSGCASLNKGWYQPGVSQQDLADDKYECMSKSQMQVNSGYAGAASSGTTPNMPLFQACMQARGYVWTNRAAVEK